jgi:MOSC domain-containing protein YiiM
MGKLIGIARAVERLAPLVQADAADIDLIDGIVGDARGRNKDRQVTIVFRESWDAACSELGVEIPWIARRANLFVEGIPTPHERAQLRIGGVILEVTKETKPCALMDKAHMGLRAALKPDWRGGVCCNVVGGGPIHVGVAVERIR